MLKEPNKGSAVGFSVFSASFSTISLFSVGLSVRFFAGRSSTAFCSSDFSIRFSTFSFGFSVASGSGIFVSPKRFVLGGRDGVIPVKVEVLNKLVAGFSASFSKIFVDISDFEAEVEDNVDPNILEAPKEGVVPKEEVEVLVNVEKGRVVVVTAIGSVVLEENGVKGDFGSGSGFVGSVS